MNVDLVKKDIGRLARDAANKTSAPQGPMGHAELPPGAIRRESPLEQDLGSAKYRKMIHEHNEKNGHVLDRLPFTFPKKKIVRTKEDRIFDCPKCGTGLLGGPTTYMITCSSCQNMFKVNQESFSPPVGIFNRASDLLGKSEEKP